MSFSDEKLQELFDKFTMLNTAYLEHLNLAYTDEQMQTAFERLAKLETNFDLHIVSSDKFRSDIVRLMEQVEGQYTATETREANLVIHQNKNTEVLDRMVSVVESQRDDTKEMISIWKDLQGFARFTDRVSKAGLAVIKFAAIISGVAGVAYAWIKSGGH